VIRLHWTVIWDVGCLRKTLLGLLIRACAKSHLLRASVVRPEIVGHDDGFGFGFGLAGLAGSFPLQIGMSATSNGQIHIVTAFHTVVVGGVAALWTVYSRWALGTVVTSFGAQVTVSRRSGKNCDARFWIILFLQSNRAACLPAVHGVWSNHGDAKQRSRSVCGRLSLRFCHIIPLPR